MAEQKDDERAETIRAQAYQVIGQLLDMAGLFEGDEGQRALDYFAGDAVDENFLPWPRIALSPRDGDAVAVKAVVTEAIRDCITLVKNTIEDGSEHEHGDRELVRKAFAELAAITSPAQPAPSGVVDAQIKHMVDRFLRWRLPEHFSPDGGVSFTPSFKEEPMRSRHWPVGTNLLDAVQTTAMVQHMIDGLPALSSKGETPEGEWRS